MRSGDGNIYCSRTIYTLVLFYSLALDASEYLISYRYQVKNATLYNEILQISKTMQKCNGKVIDSLILDNKNKNNLKDIISNNSQEFIDFIHKLGLEVQHNSYTHNIIHNSATTLTLKTTCFKVDFNENFARISPLK